MPRGLNNWQFRDVGKFLTKHGFHLNNTRGSHHYYIGSVGGEIRQVTVQKHSGETIKPRTLKNIIEQSGIDRDEWLNNRK